MVPRAVYTRDTPHTHTTLKRSRTAAQVTCLPCFHISHCPCARAEHASPAIALEPRRLCARERRGRLQKYARSLAAGPLHYTILYMISAMPADYATYRHTEPHTPTYIHNMLMRSVRNGVQSGLEIICNRWRYLRVWRAVCVVWYVY